jgi:uncharacterized protein DUF5655
MATDAELALLDLFAGKEGLLPVWARLRTHIEAFGDEVKVERREEYAVLDRRAREFAIVEPTAHHRMELGLHNPGLPFDERFREAVQLGSRRITHRVSVPENAEIDDELHARLHEAYALALQSEPA